MNIINIRIKSQNDNADWTGPKKKEKSSYEKGQATNDENCKHQIFFIRMNERFDTVWSKPFVIAPFYLDTSALKNPT